jgi:hypothetical protein
MLVVSDWGRLAYKTLTDGRLPRCQTSGVSPALAPAPWSTTKPGSRVDESLFSFQTEPQHHATPAQRSQAVTDDTRHELEAEVRRPCSQRLPSPRGKTCPPTDCPPAVPRIGNPTKQTKRSHLKPHIRPHTPDDTRPPCQTPTSSTAQ